MTSSISPLIPAGDLAALLESGEVTVLDVRYRLGGPPGAAAFAEGHVPGAVYVDLEAALAAPVGDGVRGRHPLPEPVVLEAAMRALGVREGRPVVVYDDWGGRAAARCWWLLRWAGHPHVQVLDGSWPAWVERGLPVETGPDSVVGEGDFTVRGGGLPTVEADALGGWEGVVVDARAPERYRGEVEPVDPIAGHVPGAVNVPTETNLAVDGRFRPATQLAALYAASGVDGSEPVAVYCGSGVTACHDVLALELAGIPAVLYPGSWSEWVADPDRPVATGSE